MLPKSKSLALIRFSVPYIASSDALDKTHSTLYTEPMSIRPEYELLDFQKDIINAVHNGGHSEILFSSSRGEGKTFLAAEIIADLIWEESPLYQEGKEVVVVAGTLQQASLLLDALSWMRDADNYQFTDSVNQKKITHTTDRTRMRVASSNAEGSLGLGANQSLVVADEASSWNAKEGELMHEALRFALGKPGSGLKILWISTIAPDKCTFFGKMAVEGDTKRRKCFVYRLEDESKWCDEEEVLRLNPLKASFPDSRELLLDELAAAQNDLAEEIRFKNWRLNYNAASERQVLLTAPQVKTLLDKEAQPREGAYYLGLDLGDSVAFSAAAAVWPNGRAEVLAACSGIPAIKERERLDAKPAGLYERLVREDLLHIAHGKHSTPLEFLLDIVEKRWGVPFLAAADQYRKKELADRSNWDIRFRNTTTASDANFGIAAFREYAADGRLSIAPECRPLITLALADSRVEADANGFYKCVKMNQDNTGRDDAAHALILACDLMKTEELKGGSPLVAGLF